MLKSFIQLNLQAKHDKSEYQIKKNKLIWLKNKQLLFAVNNNNNGNVNANVIDKNQTSTQHQTRIQPSQFSKCTNLEVNFDCITYDYKSTNQKILYELLMIKQPIPNNNIQNNNITTINNKNKTTNLSHQLTTNVQQNQLSSQKTQLIKKMTITFNYDIQYEKLQQLLIELMDIKKFHQSQFQIAHFQLRNNHVSDYNKAQTHRNSTSTLIFNQQFDQMDKFTKQIDTCIKLDKTYNIKENINFKKFNKSNFKSKDILNKNSRTNYDKKTNQFFILNIDQQYELNFIVLPRQKDYVLTKTEEKEIEEAFILFKGQNQKGAVKLEFTTSLAEILQSILNSSDLAILVSQYPTLTHQTTLAEQLHMPILIDPNHPSSVEEIIKQYNKQKESKLQLQMQKMKVKLRQLRHKRKTTQENISYLMKKYKKGFESIFESLGYLKKNNIHDIKAYKDNLQIEIKQKEEQIKETLQRLKEINLDMIESAQRNEYFMHKMQFLKQTLQQDLDDIQVSYNKTVGGSGGNKKGKGTNNDSGNKLQSQLLNKTNKTVDAKSRRNNRPITNTNNSDNTTKQQHKRKSQPSSFTRNTSPSTDDLSQIILKKILQNEEPKQNVFQVQMKQQIQKYTNELRQKTRQRLIKSQEVDEFHNVMDQLKKRLTKHQFTKLQQKYLALISMC